MLTPHTLRRDVSVPDVLNYYGLGAHLRHLGTRLVGPCPVHGGDNPRAFSVHPDGRLWYCFTQCHAGGDVIDLVRRLDDASFPDALKILAHIARCLPSAAAHDRPPPTGAGFQPFTRTISLDPKSPFLSRKRITAYTAARFETGAYSGNGFLHECIGVRLHDPTGAPLGYAARRLNDDQILRFGKWKFPARLPKASLLFNYHRVVHQLATTGVVVVECPWGVMRLAQLDVPAVALLGTRLFPAQSELLRAAPRLLLMFDADPAGQAAVQKAMTEPGFARRTSVANLPTNCDPDDLTDDQLRTAAQPLLS